MLTPEGRGAGVATGFILLSIIAILPILICAWPPILDYPNHLARMHILASAPLSGDLARHYRIAWSPIPDLAADLVVPILTRLMPVEIAMRVFLATVLLLLAGGTNVLQRVAFQRWSPWPLTAFLLLYNRMLLWGFINYLAGLALFTWALALWLALETRPRAARAAVGMILATAIYLAHLAAFGCFAIAILALAATPAHGEETTPRRSPITTVALRFVPAVFSLAPATLLFLLSPTSGAPARIAYGNPLRKFDLPVSIFDNYSRVFDGATFAVVALAIIIGLRRGVIRLHPRLRWCVAGLVAAFILLPSQLLSASGIDHRLPVAIAFLFVASTDVKAMRVGGARWIQVALIGLFLARMTIVTDVWLRADRQYAALLPVFDDIAPGATIAVATPPSAHAGGIPLLHFPTIAVIKRDAFVPSLFADRFQQPVRFSAADERLAAEAPPGTVWTRLSQGSRPNLAGYDDLMIIDPPPSLDRGTLPGTILFEAPRVLLVRLNTAPSDRDP